MVLIFMNNTIFFLNLHFCNSKDMSVSGKPAIPAKPMKAKLHRSSERRFKKTIFTGSRNTGLNAPPISSGLRHCSTAIPSKKIPVRDTSMEDFNALFEPLSECGEKALNEVWVWSASDASFAMETLTEEDVLRNIEYFGSGLPHVEVQITGSSYAELLEIADVNTFGCFQM